MHRIGRTGRMGRKGRVLSFITPQDSELMVDLVPILQQAHVDIPKAVQTLISSAESSRDLAARAAKRASKKQKRQKAKSKREGDWTCGLCGANVFAAKTRCFKCGAAK